MQQPPVRKAVFPVGGVRVLAYPAAHHATTDGSGNIALDGTADRTLAAEELTRLAATCKSRQTRTICIDIARRPRESVTNLARMLGADLHVLRQADAGRHHRG